MDQYREKALQLCKVFETLKSNRGTWESHWDEVARRVYPDVSEGFITKYTEPGRKKTQELFDSTAAVALNRFAAILDSLLTPRNQTWHRLQSNIDELNKDRSVRLWFEDVNRILFKFRYAPNANFSSQNQLNFKSLGAFGSASLYIDQLATEPGIRYKNCHLGEIYFMENHQGKIDTVFREFDLTARQAVQKWGDKVPVKITECLEKDPNKEFCFLHYVGPREDLSLERADFKGMPFASYYIFYEEKEIVDEGGYTTFPYTPSRYEQAPGEVYGRGPAMEVLPAIKTLNEQKKTLLKQGHRAVDPVLLVYDDGILDSFSLKPGAANAGGVTKDGKPLVHTLPVGNVMIGKDMMDDERAVINDVFLVTLFQILVESPQMTATEVLERTKEKGILLAPTIGRQREERFGPQIERELDILAMQGLLPPMPPILREAGASFKIEYDSPLSRAQRAEEASGLMRTVESALSVANVTGNLAPLDHFNWDMIIPELSDINAVPTRWRNDKRTIEAIRQGRAAQQQQQELVNAAPGIAAVTKAQKA